MPIGKHNKSPGRRLVNSRGGEEGLKGRRARSAGSSALGASAMIYPRDRHRSMSEIGARLHVPVARGGVGSGGVGGGRRSGGGPEGRTRSR
jgi:hypothetical protein